jgi:hypothetical protein
MSEATKDEGRRRKDHRRPTTDHRMDSSGPVVGGRSSVVGSATTLARAFDATFAAPADTEVEEAESLLGIRVAGDPYAIPVGDIVGLAASGRIVPVPSRAPALLGLAGVRGRALPVYSLATLLGYPHAGEPVPWLVLCGDEGSARLDAQRSTLDAQRGRTTLDLSLPEPSVERPASSVAFGRLAVLALAFHEVEGYLRVLSRDCYLPETGEAGAAHVGAVARVGGSVRPVIRIASVVAAIQAQTGPTGAARE